MRYFFAILLVLSLRTLPLHAQSMADTELLNTYLATQIHLAANERESQMVGAAWIRFKNLGAPTNKLSVLLNTGFQITAVKNARNQALSYQSELKAVDGIDGLFVEQATITLDQPIPTRDNFEIYVNYRGKLKPQSGEGFYHTQETLNQRFTMIRKDSFAYPVLADATKDGIEAAFNAAEHFPRATLTLPKGYRVAGNLNTTSFSSEGAWDKLELNTKIKQRETLLPIAKYTPKQQGAITLNHLENSSLIADAYLKNLGTISATFTAWLGNPLTGKQVTISEIPDGFQGAALNSFLTVETQELEKNAPDADAIHTLASLWQVKETDSFPSGWQNPWQDFMGILYQASQGDTAALTNYGEAAYGTLSSLIATNGDYGKMSFEDYGNEKNASLMEAGNAVFFSTLQNALGSEGLIKAMGDIYAKSGDVGISSEDFYKALAKAMPNRKLRRFVRNWSEKGTQGKDMAKASDIASLADLYK